jgi:phage terminase small subunit
MKSGHGTVVPIKRITAASKSLHQAPAGYSAEAQRLWRDVLTEWALDPAALVILDAACRALMRVRQAQRLLTRDGLVVRDRWKQIKLHPAAAIERDAKATLLRSLKALNLDLEPLRDGPGRPGRED